MERIIALVTRNVTHSTSTVTHIPKPLAEAAGWLENYRQHWEAAFERLDDLLEELKAAEKKAKRPARKW